MAQRPTSEFTILSLLLFVRMPSMKCFGHYLEFDTSDFLDITGYKSYQFYDYMERLRDGGYLKDLRICRNHVKLTFSDDFNVEFRPYNVDFSNHDHLKPLLSQLKAYCGEVNE